MFCKNCGNKLNEGDSFCTNCGNQNEPVNLPNNDELLVQAYINNEKAYQNYKKNKINIWAALFNIFYFLYKKMFLVAFLHFLVASIISYILIYVNEFVASLLSLGIFIGYLIGFNRIYKWDIERKIKKIKNNNPNVTFEQLLNIVREKGGTSILALSILIVIEFIGVIIIITVFFLVVNSVSDIPFGVWNCAEIDGTSNYDYIIKMTLNKDGTFEWADYDNPTINYVKGNYSLDSEIRSNDIYYNLTLNGDIYVVNGVVQSDDYMNTYEIEFSYYSEEDIYASVLYSTLTGSLYYCEKAS